MYTMVIAPNPWTSGHTFLKYLVLLMSALSIPMFVTIYYTNRNGYLPIVLLFITITLYSML